MSSCSTNSDCFPYCCISRKCSYTSLCNEYANFCVEHSNCASNVCYQGECSDEWKIQLVIYFIGPLLIILFGLLIWLCYRCCMEELDPQTKLPLPPKVPEPTVPPMANMPPPGSVQQLAPMSVAQGNMPIYQPNYAPPGPQAPNGYQGVNSPLISGSKNGVYNP